MCLSWFSTLRLRQNGRHFPDDILKFIFLDENIWISINISLKVVLYGPINNIPALVQIMAWCRSGAMPLPEPVMVSLLTQWVNSRGSVTKKILFHVHIWHETLSNINSSPPGQNGRHFADNVFKCIFVNETFCILIKFHWRLFLTSKGSIDNNPAFV